MHTLGTNTVSSAVSIALRTSNNITVATNNAVPIVWGERDGKPDLKRFTHSLGSFTVSVNRKGKYKISVKLNGRLTGSSLSVQNRTDNVVVFLAINNRTYKPSYLYASPYQQSGGYFTVNGVIDEISLNAGDFVALYIYRLVTTGTISIAASEAVMSIEQTSEE
jgi:hypothetical protein